MDTNYYFIHGYETCAINYITQSCYTMKRFLKDLVNGNITGWGGVFQNDSEYLVSLRFYPFQINKLYPVKSTTAIQIGNKISYVGDDYTLYNVNQELAGFSNGWVKWFEFRLTRENNDFTDFEPYTNAKLYIPLFSTVTLPLQKIYGYYIDCYIGVDLNTGNGTVTLVRRTDQFVIHTETKQLGIDLPLGKTNETEQARNRLLQSIQLIGSIATIGVGAYSGNGLAVAGGIGLATKSITGAIQNEVDHYSVKNNFSGDASSLMNPKNIVLIVEKPKDVRRPDIELRGRVLRQHRKFSSLSGYTEISDIPYFAPRGEPIYEDEINEIIDLLKTGVYFNY